MFSSCLVNLHEIENCHFVRQHRAMYTALVDRFHLQPCTLAVKSHQSSEEHQPSAWYLRLCHFPLWFLTVCVCLINNQPQKWQRHSALTETISKHHPPIATLRDNQARFGTAGERKTLSILLADFLSFPLAMADCPVQPVCVIFFTTPFLQAFIFANTLSFTCVFSARRWLLVYTVRTPSSAYESVCAAPHAPHGSGEVEMDGAMDGRRGGWTDSEGGGCMCPPLWW